jgi:hypothetical protein
VVCLVVFAGVNEQAGCGAAMLSSGSTVAIDSIAIVVSNILRAMLLLLIVYRSVELQRGTAEILKFRATRAFIFCVQMFPVVD